MSLGWKRSTGCAPPVPVGRDSSRRCRWRVKGGLPTRRGGSVQRCSAPKRRLVQRHGSVKEPDRRNYWAHVARRVLGPNCLHLTDHPSFVHDLLAICPSGIPIPLPQLSQFPDVRRRLPKVPEGCGSAAAPPLPLTRRGHKQNGDPRSEPKAVVLESLLLPETTTPRPKPGRGKLDANSVS